MRFRKGLPEKKNKYQKLFTENSEGKKHRRDSGKNLENKLESTTR
jgi:hypothetical protein